MRSLRFFTTTATHCLVHRVICAAALTIMFTLQTGAQQPAVGRQKVPRLSTDDVARPPAEPVVESKERAAKPADAAKAGTVEATAAQPKTEEAKVSPEESSWRERVSKARDRAKETERAAEQAELRITSLRNELGTSGESAKYRNETAAELEQSGQRLKELRAEARAAADDLSQLVEYGRQNGFAEAAGPKPTAGDGKPNDDYYRAQMAKLSEALESAQRRIQLYENRVRDLAQQIMSNSGGKDKNGNATGGDNFFISQLQQDRDEAQQKLDEARAALTKAQTDVDTLKEEARRAGVAPGVFR